AAYAHAFPRSFTALVDTYDTLASGVPNFLVVASALHALGFKPRGIRLDSGDLAHLSRAARELFRRLAPLLGFEAATLQIMASNDLNEHTLEALSEQGASIDGYLVGTNLVTCQAQPALGCVYKLVASGGEPRIKLSEDIKKTSIPGAKVAFRLYGEADTPLLDLLLPASTSDVALPRAGTAIRARHPFEHHKRVVVTPARVEPLHVPVWERGAPVAAHVDALATSRARCAAQVASLREDHVRALNPTPYKVSVSEELFALTQRLLMEHTPEKHLA
ncbi:MAG TPA: nicotinate phosphoribosyltransferase, partial [Myxococcota bacterium]|nr:nicotinate phosphoribosyltransferase [Myxococcota bacterium]